MPGKCTAGERFALDILKKQRHILDSGGDNNHNNND